MGHPSETSLGGGFPPQTQQGVRRRRALGRQQDRIWVRTHDCPTRRACRVRDFCPGIVLETHSRFWQDDFGRCLVWVLSGRTKMTGELATHVVPPPLQRNAVYVLRLLGDGKHAVLQARWPSLHASMTHPKAIQPVHLVCCMSTAPLHCWNLRLHLHHHRKSNKAGTFGPRARLRIRQETGLQSSPVEVGRQSSR